MNAIQSIVNQIVEGNFAYAMDEIKSHLKERISDVVENQKKFVLEQYGMSIIESEEDDDDMEDDDEEDKKDKPEDEEEVDEGCKGKQK